MDTSYRPRCCSPKTQEPLSKAQMLRARANQVRADNEDYDRVFRELQDAADRGEFGIYTRATSLTRGRLAAQGFNVTSPSGAGTWHITF